MNPWRVRRDRVLLERQWLVVREQEIDLPHGGSIDEFHLIEAPDWVAVLALTESNQVVFVDQYRHGAGKVSRELPAGVIDSGESAEHAAKRELLEETGFTADRFESLLTVHTEPSRHTNRAWFFFAAGARRAREPRLDASENIGVTLMSPSQILPAIAAGQIVHGVHIGPILLAARRGLIDLG